MRAASTSATRRDAPADAPARAARPRLPAAGGLGVPQALGRGQRLAILEMRADLDRAAREERLEELLEELRIGHVRKSLGLVALRRRAPARGNRAGPRGRTALHAAR